MPEDFTTDKPRNFDNEQVYPTLYSAEWEKMWGDRPEPKRGTPEFHDKWWGDFPRQVTKVEWPSDEWRG